MGRRQVRTLKVVGTPEGSARVGREMRLKGLEVWGCDEQWLEQIDDEERELVVLRIGAVASLGMRGAIGSHGMGGTIGSWGIEGINRMNAKGVRVLDLQNVVVTEKLFEILEAMEELEFVRIHASTCTEIGRRNFRFSEKMYMLELSTEMSSEREEVREVSRKFLHSLARPEKIEELQLPYMCQEDMEIFRFPKLKSLVILYCNPEDEPEKVAEFFQPSISTLTSLVLEMRKEALMNIDYVLWALTKFTAKYPEKLENFLISVKMADNADLIAPEISTEWTSYFRCKYKHNLYFRRLLLGVEMRPSLPGSAAGGVAALNTPMDLFAQEIFPDGEDRETVHAAWMQLHELRRLDYIDIFDAIVGANKTPDKSQVRKITPRN